MKWLKNIFDNKKRLTKIDRSLLRHPQVTGKGIIQVGISGEIIFPAVEPILQLREQIIALDKEIFTQEQSFGMWNVCGLSRFEIEEATVAHKKRMAPKYRLFEKLKSEYYESNSTGNK